MTEAVLKAINELKSTEGFGDFYYEEKRGVGEHTVDAKQHPYIEISHLSRGEGVLQAGNRVYEINEGDVIFISQGVAHSIMCTSQGGQMHRIACRPHLIPEAVREHFKTSAPVVRSRDVARVAGTLMASISKEYRSGEEYSADMLRAYVAQLSIAAARCESTLGAMLDGCPAVASTVNYIKEHSGERISLSEMARMCKVSVAYLSRKFKEEIGMGFSDYLSLSRLQRAESLLLESPDMSITEVAFSCGFNDSNYFSDKFKRQFGTSPLKFRNQSRTRGKM